MTRIAIYLIYQIFTIRCKISMQDQASAIRKLAKYVYRKKLPNATRSLHPAEREMQKRTIGSCKPFRFIEIRECNVTVVTRRVDNVCPFTPKGMPVRKKAIVFLMEIHSRNSRFGAISDKRKFFSTFF